MFVSLFVLMFTKVHYSNCRTYFITIQNIVLSHNIPPFLSIFFHMPVLHLLSLHLYVACNHFAFLTMPSFYLQCSTALCVLFSYFFLPFRNIKIIYQNGPVIQLLKYLGTMLWQQTLMSSLRPCARPSGNRPCALGWAK